MTDVLDAVSTIVGAERCSTSPADLLRFGSDFHYDGEPPCAVVRPSNLQQLRGVVKAATTRGTAVVPRGGGVSYTAGYSPNQPGCVLIDTRDLNAIVELSLEDGFVTVEAGCTWEYLRNELAPHGVRTTFEGPFSGAFATVGGALSQSAVVWGAGRYGVSANSVLSLGVVCADGSMLHTGHDSTMFSNSEDSTTTEQRSRAAPHFRP